ncbi:hypothetical protein L596_023451 [Steinernema carpocapsae]|uniref:Uncharacterized protein n=1 Tax=Steinernema carpocapsae TaxID=34508 RepID=A0A4U5MDR3_STECR|nr:hypothetical protein L596_023451 [Steinernema carpocapsae]
MWTFLLLRICYCHNQEHDVFLVLLVLCSKVVRKMTFERRLKLVGAANSKNTHLLGRMWLGLLHESPQGDAAESIIRDFGREGGPKAGRKDLKNSIKRASVSADHSTPSLIQF